MAEGVPDSLSEEEARRDVTGGGRLSVEEGSRNLSRLENVIIGVPRVNDKGRAVRIDHDRQNGSHLFAIERCMHLLDSGERRKMFQGDEGRRAERHFSFQVPFEGVSWSEPGARRGFFSIVSGLLSGGKGHKKEAGIESPGHRLWCDPVRIIPKLIQRKA